MDPLLLQPTPPNGLAPVAPLALPPAQSASVPRRSALKHALAVVRDVALLPLRLLRRFLLDTMATLNHLAGCAVAGVLASIGVGLGIVLILVESFGENFFLGEVLGALDPNIRAYISDASAFGALLVAVFPFLDEVRASTWVAFVFAGAGVAASAIFFASFHRWRATRVRTVAVQEALLLDPQAQETPATPPPPREASGALIGVAASVATTLGLLVYEMFVFSLVFGDYPWLGVVTTFALLAARLIVGYLAHVVFGFAFEQARALLLHVHGFFASLFGILPNLAEEALTRLQTLGAE